MKLLKNKRGSITVFLTIFFTGIVFMAVAFCSHSRNLAIASSVKSLGAVWNQSILGEYNKDLLDEYSLYGILGSGKDIKKKVDYYAKYSFDGKKYLHYHGCDLGLKKYSLANPKIFKKQIVDIGKLYATKKLVKKDRKEAVKDNIGIINNKAILSSLPSKDTKSGINILSAANAIKKKGSVGNFAKAMGELAFINSYIMSSFNSKISNGKVADTFFNNEIEYLIAGDKSDEKNLSDVKWKIIGIREVLNTAFLYKDPQKRSELTLAAMALTPGPEYVVTEKLLMAAWAFAESINDYQLLINGKKIPVVKTTDSWAIDIDSVINKKEKYVDTGTDLGETYDDYLKFFLCIMDENTKLLRVMDLVQINMKFKYDADFQISDYYTGIDLILKVNGEEYEISKSFYE